VREHLQIQELGDYFTATKYFGPKSHMASSITFLVVNPAHTADFNGMTHQRASIR